DRIASDDFDRHGGWFGWLKVYGPTLLLATLPWTGALWRWLRAMPARVSAWLTPAGRDGGRAALLLVPWALLPLLAFGLAQSRMPLYLRPLFVPLAVRGARQGRAEGRGLPRWRWRLAWAALLLALEFAAGQWATHKEGDAWRQ